jgi:hypothetical protein
MPDDVISLRFEATGGDKIASEARTAADGIERQTEAIKKQGEASRNYIEDARELALARKAAGEAWAAGGSGAAPAAAAAPSAAANEAAANRLLEIEALLHVAVQEEAAGRTASALAARHEAEELALALRYQKQLGISEADALAFAKQRLAAERQIAEAKDLEKRATAALLAEEKALEKAAAQRAKEEEGAARAQQSALGRAGRAAQSAGLSGLGLPGGGAISGLESLIGISGSALAFAGAGAAAAAFAVKVVAARNEAGEALRQLQREAENLQQTFTTGLHFAGLAELPALAAGAEGVIKDLSDQIDKIANGKESLGAKLWKGITGAETGDQALARLTAQDQQQRENIAAALEKQAALSREITQIAEMRLRGDTLEADEKERLLALEREIAQIRREALLGVHTAASEASLISDARRRSEIKAEQMENERMRKAQDALDAGRNAAEDAYQEKVRGAANEAARVARETTRAMEAAIKAALHEAERVQHSQARTEELKKEIEIQRAVLAGDTDRAAVIRAEMQAQKEIERIRREAPAAMRAEQEALVRKGLELEKQRIEDHRAQERADMLNKRIDDAIAARREPPAQREAQRRQQRADEQAERIARAKFIEEGEKERAALAPSEREADRRAAGEQFDRLRGRRGQGDAGAAAAFDAPGAGGAAKKPLIPEASDFFKRSGKKGGALPDDLDPLGDPTHGAGLAQQAGKAAAAEAQAAGEVGRIAASASGISSAVQSIGTAVSALAAEVASVRAQMEAIQQGL